MPLSQNTVTILHIMQEKCGVEFTPRKHKMQQFDHNELATSSQLKVPLDFDSLVPWVKSSKSASRAT